MSKVSIQDVGTVTLLSLAEKLNQMRNAHRLYSAMAKRGVSCADLHARFERLANEVDGMVDAVLFFHKVEKPGAQ